MLKLLTGSNGAGKSLRAIQRMYADHANGLKVYAHGFRNLRVPFVTDFPDPRKWRDLPPGSVLYVDEAQNLWRSRSMGKPVPPEVLDLETHRHQGLDIVLITQAPSYIDSHLRPLFSEHEHLVAWGNKQSRLFQFAECYDDVKSLGTRGRGEFQVWDHPVAHYGDYDSAEIHTPKPPIPWKYRVGRPLLWGTGVICLLYAGWVLWGVFFADPEATKRPARDPAKEKPSMLASAFEGGSRAQVTYANLKQYLDHHRPRQFEMPWSAPAYDDREVVAEPRLWCMSSGQSGDRSCSCKTEQGTDYRLPLNRCERVARWGGAYNPYAKPEGPATQPGGNTGAESRSDDASATSHNGDVRQESTSDSVPGVVPFSTTPPWPLPVASPPTAPEATP